jgi:hypothetical protein
LAASTNGLPLFQAALTNGTTEAKLYALIGIWHLAPQQFDAAAAPIIAANPPVGFRIGDIGMLVGASNIVMQIKRGSYEDYCPPKMASGDQPNPARCSERDAVVVVCPLEVSQLLAERILYHGVRGLRGCLLFDPPEPSVVLLSAL